MGIHEVTQVQYGAVTGKNPSEFQGPQNPVENVSWNDAVAFCQALSRKTGKVVRLPTEAEWEHACRAGTTTPFHTGQTTSTDQANYDGSNYVYGKGKKGAYRRKTVSVGSFKPNAWSLHNMHGNVWEWCNDWYSKSYSKEDIRDPKGWHSGSVRVLRGGGWNSYPWRCRSGTRSWYAADDRGITVGFRVVAQDIQLGRGHRWVRSHPLTTMALTITRTLNAGRYREANMSALLAWKAKDVLLEKAVKEGLPWQMHIYPHRQGLTEKLKANIKRLYDTYPGCTGWLVWDEPRRPSMITAAPTTAWLRKTFPDMLVYSNACPPAPHKRMYGKDPPPGGRYTYEQHLRDFVKIMNVDVLCYDVYPFQKVLTGNLFPLMADARKVGLAEGVPYWTIVQGGVVKTNRMPSESDVRMQVFAHLTHGFTGIIYFTYWTMTQDGSGRLPLYYDVARLNTEVRNIGQALRFLTSTDVRAVVGHGSKLRRGAVAWEPGAGDERCITGVTIDDPTPADYKDVLLGFFRDDDGRRYLMVNNLWHGPGASAADRRMKVTLHLDPSVHVVGRLSRETGAPELLRVSDGKLTLTLPGGTGDLLQLGDAKFPGLKGK